MADHTVRNTAAITIAIGSLVVAPILASTAARNLSAHPVQQSPPTRIIIVPSPVVSLVTVSPTAEPTSHGQKRHDKGHHRHQGQGGD